MIFWHPSRYGYIQNINHLVQRRGILDTPLDLLHSSVWEARLKWCVAMMQALICCLNPRSIWGFCCHKNEKIKTRLSYKTEQIVNFCSYEDVWKTTSKQKLELIYIFFEIICQCFSGLPNLVSPVNCISSGCVSHVSLSLIAGWCSESVIEVDAASCLTTVQRLISVHHCFHPLERSDATSTKYLGWK